MQRIHPSKYIQLGTDIESAIRWIGQASRGEKPWSDALPEAQYVVTELAEACKVLGLASQHETLAELSRKEDGSDLPRTVSQFDVLIETILRQMKAKSLLVLRDGFYGRTHISGDARRAFPKLTQELRAAGNSYACGLDTACVFHCMRALEYALDAMAADCGLVWTKEQWHNIIELIEAAIDKERKSLPKGTAKDERLRGLSLAAKEFFYFKDGWRNYVSHNRVTYGENDAREALDHVCTFVEHLVGKLKLVERS